MKFARYHVVRTICFYVQGACVVDSHSAHFQARKLSPLLLALACAFSPGTYANPIGGTVVNGQATFATSGNKLTVSNTPGTIINWQGFSINANEVTNFAQQSAASTVLNRVTSANPSNILGSLQSNGRVFLVNPNGIVFGAGSTVNVAGLVATTLNFSNADFLAGKHNFTASPGAQNISNAGNIKAQDGGQIYLIAPNVDNNGVITAANGEILLAAGNSVELVNAANPNLRVSITAPAGNVTNVGQLLASAGSMGLFGTIVKNTGTISANSATLQGGKIVLKAIQQADAGGNISAQGVGGGTISALADMQSGAVNVSGKLDASAPHAGNGGFIETSAAHVSFSDSTQVTTAAAHGSAGIWLIDPVDFTIAATGGNMTGAALSTSLGAGSVTILSSSGTAGTAGNINVNDTVTWSANTLTLNALNNINVNSTMNGSGTASLALQYGQGAVALNNTSTYILNNAAQINLPAGAHFSTKLGSDGATNNFTVITTLGSAGSVTTTDLQGMSGNLAGNYVLGANIDATSTSGWNASVGFAPIGTGVNFSSYTPYSGTFDGLGHTITALTITRTTPYVGLFGIISATAGIRNVGLVGGTVSGTDYTGDLVGVMLFGGTIKNSYATGNVSGATNVGGLVGNSWFGTISNSYATGTVSSTGSYVGGLVGDNNFGTVSNSYATGNVSTAASSYAGGLVGYNNGTISNSYATGSITGGTASFIGGLAGYNNSGSSISNSFWNSTVTTAGIGAGTGTSSGTVGLSTAQMKTQTNFTAATWDFTNTWIMYDTFTNPLLRSFMTPLTVTANNASKTYNGLTYSGSAGVTYSVTPNANLLGTPSYTGGTNVGSYTITPSNLYSNQQGYIISYATGTLTVTPAPLTVTGLTGTGRAYNGSTAVGVTGTAALSGLQNGETLTLGNTASGILASANAGTQSITTALTIANGTGLVSNYALTQPTTLTASITQAALTVIGTSLASNKVYDGTTAATLSGGSLSGVIGSDNVTLTQAGTFASQNVGTGITVTAADSLSGTSAGNYFITSQPTGLSANITAAPLTVTGLAGSNRAYNGSTLISLSGTAGLSGLVGSETLTLGNTSSGTLASANAGTHALTTAITIANGTGLAGNYTLTQPTLTAIISPAPLTVTGLSGTNRTYNGSTLDTLTGTAVLAGLVGSETLILGGTTNGTLASANAGTQTVNTAITLANGSGLAGNYVLTQPTLSATIAQALLTITGTTVASNKVYDGTMYATLTGGSLSGVIGSDNVTLTQAGLFASKNVGVGIAVTASDSLGGTAGGNYMILNQPTGLSANITPASLMAAIIGIPTKFYDGTTTATLTSANYNLIGLASGDSVTVSQFAATYNNANVAGANSVSTTLAAGNFTATGATLLSNYVLPTTASGSAKITPAVLTASVAAPSRVYNGTAAATPTLTITGGLIGTETVTASATATFNSANVASANLVTVNSTTLGNGLNGGLASNYSLVSGETVTANITPAVLNVTANAAIKYSGAVDPLLTYTVSGLQAADSPANTLTGSLLRDTGETGGIYLINEGALRLISDNYSPLIYTPANLIIVPRAAMNTITNVVAALPAQSAINITTAAPVVTTAMLGDTGTPAEAAANQEKKEEAGNVAVSNRAPVRTADAHTARPLPVCN